MTAGHARYGKEEWVRRSDARREAASEELLCQLLDAAFSVLHHDTADGSIAGDYERTTLRKKFARILKIRVG